MLSIKSCKKLGYSLFFATSCFFLPKNLWAAACCGGGFAKPALITGDEQSTVSLTISNAKVEALVNSSGVWQKRLESDMTQTYKFEYAHILYDSFQYGFSVPIQNRNISGIRGGESAGLGDILGQIGYEYLPEWEYNKWRPRGVGYFSITAPVGTSIYESDNALGLNTRGRGFWTFGLGTILVKKFVQWDVNTSIEIHRGLQKNIINSDLNATIKPGVGGSSSIGVGFNFNDIRLGSSIAWYFEEPINIIGGISSTGNSQRYAVGEFNVSKLFKDLWAVSFIYSDQTLFGVPNNATLSRSFLFAMQKKWER